MRAIHLAGSFTNPQHVRGLTVVLSVNFSGQRGLIRQDESFMGYEHLVHVFQQKIMRGHRVKVSFAQLAVLRLSIFDIHIIYVVAFVVVNLFSVMDCELCTAWFSVLPSNPTNYHCSFGA